MADPSVVPQDAAKDVPTAAPWAASSESTLAAETADEMASTMAAEKEPCSDQMSAYIQDTS